MDTLSLGAKYSCDIKKDKPHGFLSGLKWSPDKNTTVKYTMDCSLVNQIWLSHKLENGCKLNASFKSNMNQYGPSAPAYNGFMGYPFNYGFVFKMDN